MSFPLSAAPASVASSRVQMECLKQSTHSADSWSTRVLTLDTATATLTISRHHHPDNVFYHSLTPSAVQTWPHFSRELVNDDFYSKEARLTLCVLGTVAAVPDFREEEVALLAIPMPPATAVSTEVTETAFPPPDYTPAMAAPHTAVGVTDTAAATAMGKMRKEKPGTFDAWVLRFTTKAAYVVALQVVGLLPHVQFAQSASALGVGETKKPVYFSSGGLSALSLMTVANERPKPQRGGVQ